MTAVDKYTLKQLKGLARKRGLSTKGKRGDLIKRLRPKRKSGRPIQPRIPMHYYSEELNTLKLGRGQPPIRQRRVAIIPKYLQIEERRNAVRHLINNQTSELVNLREQGKLTQDQLGEAVKKINDLHNIQTQQRERRSASARKGAETRRREREEKRQLQLMEQRARDKSKQLEEDDIEAEARRFALRRQAEERKQQFESESERAMRPPVRRSVSIDDEEPALERVSGEITSLMERKMDEARPKRADSGMASGTEGRDSQRIRRRLKSGKMVNIRIQDDEEEEKPAPLSEAMLSTGDPFSMI